MLAVSVSSSQILPSLGSIIRLIIRSEVVLPQPEGPTSTVIWPVGASRLSSSTATVPSGYLLVTPSKTIMRANLMQGTDQRSPPETGPRPAGPPRDTGAVD